MKFQPKIEHITAYLFPICMFLHGTFKVANRYLQNPVGMTWYDKTTKGEQMPYLQVCNQYWVDKRKLAALNVSWELFEYMKRGFTGFNNYKGKESKHDVDELEQQFQQLKRDHYSFDYRKFFKNVSLTRKKFMPYCRFEEQSHNCYKLFKPVFTPSGYCLFLTPDRAPKQVVPGPIGGLRFLININNSYEPEKLLYNSGFDDGVHLSISGEWNPFLTDPIFVPNGKRAYIEVPYRFCRVQNTKWKFIKDCTERKSLDLFLNYTESGCYYECYVKSTLEKCSCSLFAYNVSLNATQILFTSTVSRMHFFQTPSTHSRVRMGRLDEKCRGECPKQCESVETRSKISYSTTDERKIKIYNHRRNRSWEPSKIMIHIYHSKIGHTLVEEHSTTTFISSLANIGGLMCLWLGLHSRIMMVTNWFRRKLNRSKSAKSPKANGEDAVGGDDQPMQADGGDAFVDGGEF